MTDALLRTEDLVVHFPAGKGKLVRAVNGVTFSLKAGETLGLVGESGCGKSTLGRAVLKLGALTGGNVVFDGIDVGAGDTAGIMQLRRETAMIFQDPYNALNPRMSIGSAIEEVLRVHKKVPPERIKERVAELMQLVGLSPALADRRPRALSGGQCQRAGIARALAVEPKLIIADECVAALDVSIQAQILNLLKDLKAKLGLTYIFISHNLAVVDYVADRIMVMCAGRVVEVAPTAELFRNPVHPYTKALLNAVPNPSLENPLDFNRVMEGKTSVPSAWPGPFTIDGDNQPTLVDIGNGHWVRAALSIRSFAA